MYFSQIVDKIVIFTRKLLMNSTCPIKRNIVAKDYQINQEIIPRCLIEILDIVLRKLWIEVWNRVHSDIYAQY